jgi:hypothetical protein
LSKSMHFFAVVKNRPKIWSISQFKKNWPKKRITQQAKFAQSGHTGLMSPLWWWWGSKMATKKLFLNVSLYIHTYIYQHQTIYRDSRYGQAFYVGSLAEGIGLLIVT